MVFAKEDKVFIRNLYLIIGYGLRTLMRKLPGKGCRGEWWTLSAKLIC